MNGSAREAPFLAPGDLVVLRNRKWDGSAHWVVPGYFLGEDVHGQWIAQPAGSFCARPGVAFFAPSDGLLLVPRRGETIATFFDASHPAGVQLYVDIATDLRWARSSPRLVELTLIDMDLDVIKMRQNPTGGEPVFIDDEDEFAHHQASMGYPREMAELMRSESYRILAAVQAGEPPFDGLPVEEYPDGTAAGWFARLRGRFPAAGPVPSREGQA